MSVDRAGEGLRTEEFVRFQELIHREAGIWLSPAKKALLVGRLSRRLRELGLASLGAYHELVVRDEAERVRMLDAICTNETHFFREPGHFDFIARTLAPRWRAAAEAGVRPRTVRAWSAACSTGEEPYSLAMVLLDALPGWDVRILATDLSTRVLDRARGATWPLAKSRDIPPEHLKRYMLRGEGPQAGKMRAGPELRAVIDFLRANLSSDEWPAAGPFDLVLCRNVLIYFDARTKERVVGRLLSTLAPDGHLFLGHAESLIGFGRTATCVAPTVYMRSDVLEAARGAGA